MALLNSDNPGRTPTPATKPPKDKPTRDISVPLGTKAISPVDYATFMSPASPGAAPEAATPTVKQAAPIPMSEPTETKTPKLKAIGATKGPDPAESRKRLMDTRRDKLTAMPFGVSPVFKDTVASANFSNKVQAQNDLVQQQMDSGKLDFDAIMAGSEATYGTEDNTITGVPKQVIDKEATKLARQEARKEAQKDAPVTRELTWERYNNLSDTQRAGVDFNTMLVRAREKDLNADYDPSATQSNKYDAALDELFGENAKAAIYAPETLAVLQQVKWEPKEGEVGDDLDDFLKLDVAITGKQLRSMDIKQIDSSTMSVAPLGDLTEVQQVLVESTNTLQDQMVEAGKVLQNFDAAAALDRGDMTKYFGGTENKVNIGMGYGTAPEDQQFQAAFDVIADKNYEAKFGRSPEEGFALLAGALKADGQLDGFLRYADRRTKLASEYELPLGTQMRVKYRSPEEFRKIFGFDKED